VYAKLDREKERERERQKRSCSDYLCEDRTRTPFLTLFFIVPFFRRERTDGEHAKESERETMVYRLYQRIRSLALCVDSKKYYNLCLAGREKYNSLFRQVYKENDNGVPRMGESRPPPREEKGLKTAKGGSYPDQTRIADKLETGKKLYFILSCFLTCNAFNMDISLFSVSCIG